MNQAKTSIELFPSLRSQKVAHALAQKVKRGLCTNPAFVFMAPADAKKAPAFTSAKFTFGWKSIITFKSHSPVAARIMKVILQTVDKLVEKRSSELWVKITELRFGTSYAINICIAHSVFIQKIECWGPSCWVLGFFTASKHQQNGFDDNFRHCWDPRNLLSVLLKLWVQQLETSNNSIYYSSGWYKPSNSCELRLTA